MALVEQLGFSHVTHLSEGIMGWTNDGYQTIEYNP
jgi:rhodanese-related sulfurtransferase